MSAFPSVDNSAPLPLTATAVDTNIIDQGNVFNGPSGSLTRPLSHPLTPNYEDGRPRPPDLSSYLFKLKHHPSIIGSWTKRYWMINPRTETLEYYPSMEDRDLGKRPKREIAINHILAVRAVGDWYMQIIVRGEKHDEIVYNLKVEKVETKQLWVTELGNYFSLLKAYEEEKYKSTPRTKAIPEAMEGYLYKLKHKPSSFGSWTKRYFKVYICYFLSVFSLYLSLRPSLYILRDFFSLYP